MQSSTDKHFAGKQHGDTKTFDDSALLTQFQGAPHKIQELVIAHNGKNIIGLKAKYLVLGWNQTVEGPANYGSDSNGLREEVLRLNEDEYVTEVFGQGGDIIDHIGIKTSTGRSWDFGGHGGNKFHLSAPEGSQFTVLRGGLGGHLHNINLQVAPLPSNGQPQGYQPQGYQPQGNQTQGYQPQGYQPTSFSIGQGSHQANVSVVPSGYESHSFTPIQPYHAKSEEFLKGKKHGDTANFSDEELLKNLGGKHKIKTIHVYHDGQSVAGVSADYQSLGSHEVLKGHRHIGKNHGGNVKEEVLELASDEFLTGIAGRHGNIIDSLTFSTNKGRKLEAGGKGGSTSFELSAPQGHHFAVAKGGLGGDLHNVEFVAYPLPQQSGARLEGDFRRGKSHGDTESFDDEKVLKNYPPTHKIWKLTVFHDRKNVFGLQADYFIFGPNICVQGDRHVGNKWTGGVEDVIEFGADEYITEVSGRHGDIVDNLSFATSKGRKFSFGGSGGNAFEVKAPHGYHFGTVAGGFGGHLHNVNFHVVPTQH